jgi:hypothetical protein
MRSRVQDYTQLYKIVETMEGINPMANFDAHKDAFPHAKLTRSPDGLPEVVLYTNDAADRSIIQTRTIWHGPDRQAGVICEKTEWNHPPRC